MLESVDYSDVDEDDTTSDGEDSAEGKNGLHPSVKRHLPPEDAILAKRIRILDIMANHILPSTSQSSELIEVEFDETQDDPATCWEEEQVAALPHNLPKLPGPAGMLPENDDDDDEVPDRPHSPEVPWSVMCADFELARNTTRATVQELQEFDKENEDKQAAWKHLNIGWIRRKVIAKPRTMWKMPFLAAVINSVHNSCPDPCIVLGDRTGHIIANIKQDLFLRYENELAPGSAITLVRTGVISTGYGVGSRHFLTITDKNILSIYSYNSNIPYRVETTVLQTISEDQLQKAFEECKGVEFKSLDGDNAPSSPTMLDSEYPSFDGTFGTDMPQDYLDSYLYPVPSTSTGIVSAGTMAPGEPESGVRVHVLRKRKTSFIFKIPQKTLKLDGSPVEDEQMDTSSSDANDVQEKMVTDEPMTDVSIPAPVESVKQFTGCSASNILQGLDTSLFFEDF